MSNGTMWSAGGLLKSRHGNGRVGLRERELLLDVVFPDCCFGRGQRRISDKTAHTSTFDFGGLIDQVCVHRW